MFFLWSYVNTKFLIVAFAGVYQGLPAYNRNPLKHRGVQVCQLWTKSPFTRALYTWWDNPISVVSMDTLLNKPIGSFLLTEHLLGAERKSLQMYNRDEFFLNHTAGALSPICPLFFPVVKWTTLDQTGSVDNALISKVTFHSLLRYCMTSNNWFCFKIHSPGKNKEGRCVNGNFEQQILIFS